GLGFGWATFWPWWALGWAARFAARAGAAAGAARLVVIPWRAAARPPASSTELWVGCAALAFGAVVAVANRRSGRAIAAIALASPVEQGTFAVVQGGSVLVNHHWRDRAQRYALDLVAVSAVHGRTLRWRAHLLDDFRAFGRPVCCPIAGTVVEAVDGHDDG